jgi:hypothetical protein
VPIFCAKRQHKSGIGCAIDSCQSFCFERLKPPLQMPPFILPYFRIPCYLERWSSTRSLTSASFNDI